MDYATVDFNCSTSTSHATPDTCASIVPGRNDLITAIDRDPATSAIITTTDAGTI